MALVHVSPALLPIYFRLITSWVTLLLCKPVPLNIHSVDFAYFLI